MANGEIARFEQFLLMSLCFLKAVCCRGVRKRLYEGKGYNAYRHGIQVFSSNIFFIYQISHHTISQMTT